MEHVSHTQNGPVNDRKRDTPPEHIPQLHHNIRCLRQEIRTDQTGIQASMVRHSHQAGQTVAEAYASRTNTEDDPQRRTQHLAVICPRHIEAG